MTEQQKLLIHLSEEAHEVSVASSALGIRAIKAARFGMDEIQEGQDLTNAQRILKAYYAALDEFTDLVAMMEMVFEGNPEITIPSHINRYKIQEKKLKVLEWAKYAEGLKP